MIILRVKCLFNSFSLFYFVSLCVCLGSVTDWDSVSQISASNILAVQSVQCVHAYCVQSVQLHWPLASAADKPAQNIQNCTINNTFVWFFHIFYICFMLKQHAHTEIVTVTDADLIQIAPVPYCIYFDLWNHTKTTIGKHNFF